METPGKERPNATNLFWEPQGLSSSSTTTRGGGLSPLSLAIPSAGVGLRKTVDMQGMQQTVSDTKLPKLFLTSPVN